MFYHYRLLIQEEYKAYLNNKEFVLNNQVMRAFVPFHEDESYTLRSFIEGMYNSEDLKIFLENEKDELESVVSEWEMQRMHNIEMLLQCKIVEDKHLLNFYLSQEKEIIL